MSFQRDFSGKSVDSISSSAKSSANSPNGSTDPNASEEEFTLLKVIVYDKHTNATHLKITRTIVARDVCKNMSVRLNIDKNESKFFTLVLSITTIDPIRRTNIHCIRTLQPEEAVLVVLDDIVNKLGEKYQVSDLNRLRSVASWYFKDPRSGPIDFNDAGNIVGEYSSDEEEEMSPSDLLYFSKADRKGYLLKRSNKDINVWKRWYCVLTDHMWCIDPNRDIPKGICIRLSGVVRSKEGISYSEQIQNIIVNSPKGTHLFRAFNVLDQRTWMEELTTFAASATDNEYFSMAEVIIQDEEQSKTRRFRKALEKMLSLPPLLEAMQIDHRKAPRSRQNTISSLDFDLNEDFDTKTDGDNNGSGRVVWEQQRLQSFNAVNAGLERKSSYTSVFSDHSHDDLQQQSQHQQCVPYMVHPLDRTMVSPIGHRLHLYEHLLTHYLSFLLDVLAYKELFRHDLFYTTKEQKKCAVRIVVTHLVPQARHHVMPLPRHLITTFMAYKAQMQLQQERRQDQLQQFQQQQQSSRQTAGSMVQERNIRFPLIHRLRSNFGARGHVLSKDPNSRPSTSDRMKSNYDSNTDEFWGLSKNALEKVITTLFGDQTQSQQASNSSQSSSTVTSPHVKSGRDSGSPTPGGANGKAANRPSTGLGGFFNIFSSSSSNTVNEINSRSPSTGQSSLPNRNSSYAARLSLNTTSGGAMINNGKVRVGAGKLKNGIDGALAPSQTKGESDEDEEEYGEHYYNVIVTAELFDELMNEIIAFLSSSPQQQSSEEENR